MDLESLLERVDAAAARLQDRLISTSLAIHSHPEIVFQERKLPCS